MGKTNLNITDILEFEFQKRKRVNHRYSLRSFAQFLDVDFSLLSKVLRRQRNFSSKTQEECLAKLNIKLEDLNPDTKSPRKDYSIIDSDKFKLLSHWRHLSILELLKIKSYRENKTLIASKFKTNQEQIEESLKLLSENGLLKINNSGQIELTSPDNNCIRKESTSYARKEYIKSIFSKALTAVDEVDFTQRDHSALTVLASPDQIDEIKDEIYKFRQKIDILLDKKTDKQDVYQLAVGFFPVTRKQGE